MIKKLKIELAVFLMIALVAFGGLMSLSLGSDSDNELAGSAVQTTSPGETCLARGEKPRLGACCDKNNKCTTTGETACYAWHGVRWIQGKTCPWLGGRGPC